MLRHPRRPHGSAAFARLGEDFARIDRAAEIVDADSLDAWYDPSPTALAAVSDHLAWLMRTTPPVEAAGLRDAIAQVRGLPRECVLVGAGATALAHAALPQLVRPGDRPLVLDPGHPEHARWFEAVEGMRCARVALEGADDYDLRAEPCVAALESADVAVIANPNDPTGRLAPPELLRAILDALPRFGWLVVDETHSGFALDAASVEAWVAEEPRLVVLRSLSAFHALSGLRVGYLAAHADVVAKLEARATPWSVGTVAQIAAIEALRDPGYYEAMRIRTAELRERMQAALGALPGVRAIPSVAGFLMLELSPETPPPAEVVARACLAGVLLFDASDLGNAGRRLLRVAVRDVGAQDRIVAALSAALRG